MKHTTPTLKQLVEAPRTLKSLLSIEINEMEIDECQRLSKKFGDEYIYIHMSEKK